MAWRCGGGVGRSIPAFEGAVARLLHVVEAFTQFVKVLVSTAAFDNGVRQVLPPELWSHLWPNCGGRDFRHFCGALTELLRILESFPAL